MTPYVFVVRGDLADIRADVLIIPTSTAAKGTSETIKAVMQGWGETTLATRLSGARESLKKPGNCVSFRVNEARRHLPQGVVMVATVQGSVDAGEVRAASRGAVVEARQLIEELREGQLVRPHWGEPSDTRRPRAIVAMGALATGAGGGQTVAAHLAQAQLEGVMEGLEGSADLDVVIVAFDHDAHTRLLDARDGVRDARQHSEELRGDLRAIRTAVQDDACVLFVGAGLSMGVGLPGWGELIASMEQELPPASRKQVPALGSKDRHKVIAQLYATTGPGRGSQRHYSKIGETFGPSATANVPLSIAHYLLLSLPVRYVVTTNYDGLVERTLERQRTPTRTVVKGADVALSGGRHGTTVFKIHGHATDDGAEEVVLTDAEYSAFDEQHAAKAALLQALLLNHHFLFVGYGLGDANLNTVRDKVSRMLQSTSRRAWVTHLTRDPLANAGLLTPLGFDDARALAIALDTLASTCVARTRRLFANQHAAPSTALEPLCDSLRQAGDAAEALVNKASTPFEVEAAFHTMQALAELGWRPSKGTRFGLWKRVARTSQPGRSLWQRGWRAALADATTVAERKSAAESLAMPEDTSTGVS